MEKSNKSLENPDLKLTTIPQRKVTKARKEKESVHLIGK